MTATYEFDAFLNKEILNESDLLASKIIYKLIISDSKINPIYKVLRFEAFKSSENLNPSMKNTNNYDGMMFVLTGEGKIEEIITYKKGMKVASFKESVLDTYKQKSPYARKEPAICDPTSFYYNMKECGSAGGNGGGGGYVLETTNHYTDWYKRDSNGTYLHINGYYYSYTSTRLDNISTRWVWVSNTTYNYSFNTYTADGPDPDHNSYPHYTGTDRIINNLTDKAECVYRKMVGNNNNINWILENFQDGDKPSEFNLILEMSTTLGSLTNASFATPFQSGIVNTFVISINANTLSGRTSLGLARTIIHEGIHARLWEFAYRNGGSVVKNDFPGIYEYMREHKYNWDHQQMADHYRATIAKGLKQFDNGQHSDAYYNALAWEGLSEIKDKNGDGSLIYTEAWKKLTDSEQATILQTITNEKANGNKNCI